MIGRFILHLKGYVIKAEDGVSFARRKLIKRDLHDIMQIAKLPEYVSIN